MPHRTFERYVEWRTNIYHMGPSYTLQDNVSSLVQSHKYPWQRLYYYNKTSQWISKVPLWSSTILAENHYLRDLERKGIQDMVCLLPTLLHILVVVLQARGEGTPLAARLYLLHVGPCRWPISSVTWAGWLGRVCHCPPWTEPFTQHLLQTLGNFCVTRELLF